MSDPLSAFAAVQSVLSLAQFAIGACQELFKLISKIRNAPALLLRLNEEVVQVNDILTEIQWLVQSYQDSSLVCRTSGSCNILRRELNGAAEDVLELKKIVDEPPTVHKSRLDYLKISLKPVWNESQISEILCRLAARKQNLHLGLSIILGTSLSKFFLGTSKALCSIEDSQAILQSQVTELAARDQRLSQASKATGVDLRLEARTAPWDMGQDATVLLSGQIKDCAASLSYLCYHVYRALKIPDPDTQLLISRSHSNWLLCEFHALQRDIYAGKVQERKPRQLDQPFVSPSHWIESTDWNLPTTVSSTAACSQVLPRFSCLMPISEMAILEQDTCTGNFLIMIGNASEVLNGVDQHRSMIIARLFFVPNIGSRASICGIAATFIRSTSSVYSILRTISTFRIHPKGCRIFEHIETRRINLVRKMLAAGLVDPNDRDEDGNSLLWYAVSKTHDFDLCSLLLKEGADPTHCNRYGDHPLAVLVVNLPKNRDDEEDEKGEVIRLVQLLMQHCSKEEVHYSYQYKRRRGIELAPAGLLHCVFARNNSKIPIFKLLSLILEKGFDIETRDINGNTPLLYALFYVPQPRLFAVVAALMRAGARTDAVNRFGEGCLHLFLRRLSACNDCGMSLESKRLIVDHLVMLLEKNCDPVLPNEVGSTPLDTAMSPTAWPLFCHALETVGMDVKKLIMSIDRKIGIMHLDSEIESRLDQLDLKCGNMALKLPDPYLHPSSAESCYLCDDCANQSHLDVRDFPFDEFYSVVVDELGFGLHMTCYKHRHMGECLKVFNEDSCHFLDYCPSSMSITDLQERSWRKHVAYLMWRKEML